MNKLILDKISKWYGFRELAYNIRCGRYLNDLYSSIKSVFWPCHSIIHKSIPRQWVDLPELIVDINLAIIRDFVEVEYNQNTVDWQESSKEHAEFEIWLKAAYRYVTVERPALQKQMQAAYPKFKSQDFDEMMDEMSNDSLTYTQKYGKVDKIEREINERDTNVMVRTIELRKFFWT